MQLLDQSPAAYDEIIFMDLLADYNVRLDMQVISGAGTGAQVTGIRNVAGTNVTTFTSASPTMALMYPKLIKSLADVATLRFIPAQAFVMHPRRWAWMVGQLDGNSRPFLVPNEQGPQNAFGGFQSVRSEASVGSIGGVPVYCDANIPVNLGAGTNEDVILACRFDDLYLYEGNLRTRVLFETDADQLKVRFQLFNYVAFLGGRYPASISTVVGTGLNAILT
jgi:HK97 family phage major capsid protein